MRLALMLLAIVATSSCVSNNQSVASKSVVCSAFCKYRTSKGAFGRLWFSQVNVDTTKAWQQLEQTCQEITCQGCTYELQASVEPVIVDGQKEYGMKTAKMEESCSAVVFPMEK
ncbi:MAG: hypothetical protein NT027_16315 [Proteobacteria bacterium]|nr:hypothetical protein [Pseudomonadota bacterium]